MTWLRFNRPERMQARVEALQERVRTEKAVDAALRRWRNSVVPVEDPSSVGDRRTKTLTTIGAAMRQGQLERQRQHQHRRWGYALFAAATLMGVTAAGYYASSASAPAVAQAAAAPAVLLPESGDVWAGASSAVELMRHAPLGAGRTQALRVGDRVVTRAGGNAGLELGRDTSVKMHQKSELVLARHEASEKRLALRDGAIDVTVDRLEGEHRRQVVVETPDAMVVVHGTIFSVAVDRDAGVTTTTVRVARGVVAVLQGGLERARLHAGQTWTSRKVGALPAAQSTPAPSQTASEVVSDQASTQPGSARAARRGVPIQRGGAQTGRPALAAATKIAEDTEASEAAIVSSTLEQENRLFRLAVDARNSGDDGTAARYFGQLLAKYPNSTLAQEAKVERFRALKRMGKGREAAREARQYLIEHGNGFAQDEARDIALTPNP